MLKIGPTFTDELLAAGVSLDGLAWNTEMGEIIASDGDDHKAAAEAVLAKHDPTKELVVHADSITARQLRLWLLSKGLKSAQVEAAIATLPADQRDAAEIEWEYTSNFLITNPLVAVIGGVLLSLDPAGIQAGFDDAAKL